MEEHKNNKQMEQTYNSRSSKVTKSDKTIPFYEYVCEVCQQVLTGLTHKDLDKNIRNHYFFKHQILGVKG